MHTYDLWVCCTHVCFVCCVSARQSLSSMSSLWHYITNWCKIFILYSCWIQHTELGLDSLVLRAIAFSAKLVSTTEFRASPGRAPLGLILRLVSAVCGRGHNIGWREDNTKLQFDLLWIVCWTFYPQSPIDWFPTPPSSLHLVRLIHFCPDSSDDVTVGPSEDK